MSSEDQTNNDQENNNDKKNTSNLNLTKEELLKNPIIKSLFVKIDVLKNGILDERKKVSELTNKIKELEAELNSKNEEIKTLKENSEKIQSESSSTNTYEVGKLNDEITKLKFENETFLKKMNKTLIEAEDAKHEYKNQIKSLSEKNNLLLDEINSLKLEKDKLEEKVKLVSNVSYDSVREKERFEALLSEYKKAKEEAIHQLDACLEKCSKLVLKNKEYEDSIALHESNANKMALKLAEYKNMLIKVNLRNQIYHVKRVGLVSHNNGMDITFGQDKEGNYVMRIDDEKGNVELINIQDVESVNQINEKK
jgi:chromosome segregation ATPase